MRPFRLEPFQLGDAGTLIGWASSPEFLLQWVGATFRYPLDREQVAEHLKLAEGPDPEVRAYKLVQADSDEMVGFIELCALDYHNRSGRLGRVIVGPEELRGRGVGEWMVREVVRMGFGELALHRIDLQVFDFNRGAIRCYEKVGFRHEGVLRESRRIGDEYWTLLTMGLLDREWSASREERTAEQPGTSRLRSAFSAPLPPAGASRLGG